jgi:hypothetical protein
MAQAGALPTLDLYAGAAALDRDVPRVLALLGVTSLDDPGWSRPNKLTLLVPMCATDSHGNPQEFLLRLGFEAYPAWPPSAQFVNPETKIFTPSQDRHFIPKLTSQECYTHAAYIARRTARSCFRPWRNGGHASRKISRAFQMS